MEKLISMVEFTIQQNMNFANKEIISIDKLQTIILKYAIFLKQPLTLGFFVPCDLEVNVIKEYDWVAPDGIKWEDYEKELLEAKDRVLFKGFESIGENLFTARVANGINSYLIRDIETGMIVEDLVKDGLELTESAKKQILGL
ncbi:hypothetical protein D3C86_537330 [compost metagenome]